MDHIAENTFELVAVSELAVTMEAYIKAIAFDILSRLEIPIIWITDGDCNDIAHRTEIHPGSLVLKLETGNYDFQGGKKLKLEFLEGKNSAFLDDIYSFKKNEVKLAEPLIEAIFEY